MRFNLIFIKIIILFCSFLLINCNKDTSKQSSVVFTIKPLEKNILKNIDFFNKNTTFEYTPLKLNKKFLIAEMSKVIEFENIFYILDKKYDRIYFYDNKGNFINAIYDIGSGPGQFISINDFDIDEKKKELILYSLESMKIIHFSLNGSFIKELKVPFFGSDFLIFENWEKYVFYLNNNPSLEKENFNLVYTNHDNKIQKSFFEFSKESSFSMEFSGGITKGLNNIVYNTPLSDTIYNCNESSCTAKYIINFGSNKCPEDAKKSILQINKLMKCSYLLNHVYESSQMLIFPFIHNRYPRVAYYDKKYKILINNNLENSPFSIIRPPIGLDLKSNKFYSYISKDYLEMALLNEPKIIDNLKNDHPYFAKMLNKLTDNDNPILISYSFKK